MFAIWVGQLIVVLLEELCLVLRVTSYIVLHQIVAHLILDVHARGMECIRGIAQQQEQQGLKAAQEHQRLDGQESVITTHLILVHIRVQQEPMSLPQANVEHTHHQEVTLVHQEEL